MVKHELSDDRILEMVNYMLSGFENGSVDIKKNLQELIGENELSLIYPKNIFEKDQEIKEYYVFHGNLISKIKRGSMDSTISTYPLKVSGMVFQRSNRFEYGDVKLEIHLESGIILEFDAEKESNQTWSRHYSEVIKGIHDMLIAKM